MLCHIKCHLDPEWIESTCRKGCPCSLNRFGAHHNTPFRQICWATMIHILVTPQDLDEVSGQCLLVHTTRIDTSCALHLKSLEVTPLPSCMLYSEDSINGTPFVQTLVSHLRKNPAYELHFVWYCEFWFHQDRPIYTGIPCVYRPTYRLLTVVSSVVQSKYIVCTPAGKIWN